MKLGVIAVMVGAVVALAPSGWADATSFEDPDDSPGPLDVATARHGHARLDTGRRLISHKLVTYEPWETELLADPAFHIDFRFSNDTDGRFERRLRVDVAEDGQTLVAEMRNLETDKVIGFALAWRSSERGIVVLFPKGWIKRGALEHYRWSAFAASVSVPPGEPHPDCEFEGEVISCNDVVPNEGTIRAGA